MGLFSRVKNIVTADVHEALDKCEKPLAMLNQYLRDMDGKLTEAKNALAEQYYLEKRYDLLVAEKEQVIAKRASQAELAVSRGEDSIAKIALQEKIIEEAKLERLQHQAAITKANTAKLLEQIDELKAQYQDFQFKKLELESRAHAARSIAKGHEWLSSLKYEDHSKGLARASELVYRLEAEAQVAEQFATKSHTPVISPLFQQEVEKQLASLKEPNSETNTVE